MKNGKVDIWPRCRHMTTQAHKGYIYKSLYKYTYIYKKNIEVERAGERERERDIMQGIGNCYLSLEQWEEAVQVQSERASERERERAICICIYIYI